MTKHAVETLSEALRAELEHHHIKVVVIEPGPYATGFNELLMASKYRWFNDASLFAGDMDLVKKSETEILESQFDSGPVVAQHPDSLVALIADVVEDPDPAFRYCAPSQWNENVRNLLIENANDSVGKG